MSQSPPERPTPPGEGAFGAPPGAPQWAPPPPQQAPVYAPPPQHQQPYPQQGYPPAYSPQPAYAGYAPAATSPFPVSTLVLLVVSIISIVATGIIGIPSAVLAVLAWRLNAQDPTAATRRTTRAWIVYAVNFAIAIPLLIWFYVWALSNQ